MRPRLTEKNSVDMPAEQFDEFVRCPVSFSQSQDPRPVQVLAGSHDFGVTMQWLREGRPYQSCPRPGEIVDGPPDDHVILARLGSRTYVVGFPGADCW
ncbi:hypothetical protein [Cryptosporangium sp. NPDC048952]|uniref:hypothetical protein n=1 Tax=Cryptosporangium sp. NPDC048952 TaxID=3363961 RepID=UPI00371049AC